MRLRSDEQLVALFRAGHDEAFRAIHDRYRTRLFAYSRQMLSGSAQDAEDALQDVFVRAYSGLRANDRELALRAWLYRVAHNRCIDQLRRPAPVAAEVIEQTSGRADDPIAAAEQREALRRLIADVRRLPDQQRSALLMRELSGMSYLELADALALSVPAVKSLLVRARVSLAAAAEARDTACSAIRDELADCHERGVRSSSTVRRHLHDCEGCREFRASVRLVSRNLAAVAPAVGPLAPILKLLGVGSGAAVGGSSGVGGGAVVAGGAAAGAGGALATGVLGGAGAHVAALLATAVVAAGGAAEIQPVLLGSPTGHARTAGSHAGALQLGETAAALAAGGPAPLSVTAAGGAVPGATSSAVRTAVLSGARGAGARGGGARGVTVGGPSDAQASASSSAAGISGPAAQTGATGSGGSGSTAGGSGSVAGVAAGAVTSLGQTMPGSTDTGGASSQSGTSGGTSSTSGSGSTSTTGSGATSGSSGSTSPTSSSTGTSSSGSTSSGTSGSGTSGTSGSGTSGTSGSGTSTSTGTTSGSGSYTGSGSTGG